jgi:dienelactone hydrolase
MRHRPFGTAGLWQAVPRRFRAPHTPPIRQALSEAFAGCPVDYCYEVHPGAEHGYALPDRDIHDKRAANRDWELIFAIFRRQLSA